MAMVAMAGLTLATAATVTNHTAAAASVILESGMNLTSDGTNPLTSPRPPVTTTRRPGSGNWDPSRNLTSPSSPVLFTACSLAIAVYVTAAVAGQHSKGWGRCRQDRVSTVGRAVFSVFMMGILWFVFAMSLIAGNPKPSFTEGSSEEGRPEGSGEGSGEEGTGLPFLPVAAGRTQAETPTHTGAVAGEVVCMLALLATDLYVVYAFWSMWGGEPAGDHQADPAPPAQVADEGPPPSRAALCGELLVSLARAMLVLFVLLSSPTDQLGNKSVRLGAIKVTIWLLAIASFGGLSYYLNGLVAHSQLLSVLNALIKDSPQAAAYMRANMTFYLDPQNGMVDPDEMVDPFASTSNMTILTTRAILSTLFPGRNVTLEVAGRFVAAHGASVAAMVTMISVIFTCGCTWLCRAKICSASVHHHYGMDKQSRSVSSSNLELATLAPHAVAQLNLEAPAAVAQELAEEELDDLADLDDLAEGLAQEEGLAMEEGLAASLAEDLVDDLMLDAEVSYYDLQTKVTLAQAALVQISRDDFNFLHRQYMKQKGGEPEKEKPEPEPEEDQGGEQEEEKGTGRAEGGG